MSREISALIAFELQIDEIQNQASKNVDLIRELAGLEGYIAETYAQRCLSELFQNSDDCGSTEVGIFRISDYLVYANNGRVFSSVDFESLCKSASSSKVRGKSIGYRGIGLSLSSTYAQM